MTNSIKYLTASQVARQLNLSSERVRQLARSGALPADQETSLGRLWSTETVDRFEQTRDPWGRFVSRPSSNLPKVADSGPGGSDATPS